MRHETDTIITGKPPPATLANLPASACFPGRHPWTIVPSRIMAARLNLDRGLLGVWRLRNIGPTELPPAWFKGRANCYQISALQCWLAARHGEQLSEVKIWAAYLCDALGVEVDETQARWWARKFAEKDGPRSAEGVRFTSAGWRAYLDSLQGETIT